MDPQHLHRMTHSTNRGRTGAWAMRALGLGILVVMPSSAHAATVNCPRVAISANSGNVATRVTATNVSCGTARRVIIGKRRDKRRSPLGYRCYSAQIGSGIEGELRYTCTKGLQQVKWSN